MSGAAADGAGPGRRDGAAASSWNVANALTVVRLLLVPAFVALLATDDPGNGRRVLAWAVFAVAAATDYVDGELARRRGLITDFGKIADPIADKAVTGAALICLSLLGDLPWWVTVLILAREVGITALRFWVIRHGVMAASRGGKLKTLLQGVAIGLFILPHPGFFGVLAWIVMVAAVVVTVVTGADYVARALRLRQTSDRAKLKRRRRDERAAGVRRTP